MARKDSASEIRDRLCEELTARLGDSGWRSVEGPNRRASVLATYDRPMTDDFAATAQVGRAFIVPDVPPVRIPIPRVGVSYEPLRRLGPTLSGRDWTTILYQNPTEIAAWAGKWPGEIASRGDVSSIAEAMATLIDQRAVAFAGRHASVDALLKAYGWGSSDVVEPVVAALLLAAGRLDDARRALTLCRQESEAQDDDRQLIYQLGRQLQVGVRAGPTVCAPPTGGYRMAVTRPTLASTLREARIRHGAIEAARKARGCTDRSVLANIIRGYLEQRDMREEPLWIEQQVEMLYLKGASAATAKKKAVYEAAEECFAIGASIVGVLRGKIPANMPVPSWLEPPAAAVYVVPQEQSPGHRWAEVVLRVSSLKRLDEIYAATPRRSTNVRSVTLAAWLARGADAGGVTVNIGDSAVGSLDRETERDYDDIVAIAFARRELPRVTVRLTRIATRADGYLLEVARPARVLG